MTEKPPVIEILADPATLAHRACAIIVQAAAEAIAARGRFVVALAGGATPAAAYRLLATAETGIDTDRTYLFLGDERMVPYEHPDSNYRMIHETLLSSGTFPETRFFPIPTQGRTAKEAALLYDASLADFFHLPVDGPKLPVFDLIVLGLGDDGHTASLFPGKPALDVTTTWATATTPGVLPPPVDRVTLTFPVLNAARHILFLATGDKKSPALRRVLKDHADLHDAPAAGVRPTDGTVTWLLDEAAARHLRIGE